MSTLLRLYLYAAWLATAAVAADAAGGAGVAEQSGPIECATAVLHNGFSIPFIRREAEGATTRLWLCDGGDAAYVAIPSDQIEGFERAEEATPPAPAKGALDVKAVPSHVGPAKDPIGVLISEVAGRHQIDADFLASVVAVESRFNPAAVSHKGAQGLMQLMPQTALRLRVRNAFDPSENLEAGTKYLRQLLDRYHWDAVKALAAYNAGPQRVEEYGGIPPFRETRAYITRIIEDFNRKKARQAPMEQPPAR